MEITCKYCEHTLGVILNGTAESTVECPVCHKVWGIKRATDPDGKTYGEGAIVREILSVVGKEGSEEQIFDEGEKSKKKTADEGIEESARIEDEKERLYQEFLRVCEVEGNTLKKYNGYGGDVVIPDNITRIGDEAFMDHDDFSSILIPNSVTRIGKGAFAGCNGLEFISIPDSVTRIDDEAFSCCEGLESLTLGKGLKRIGSMAFSYCPNLTSITVTFEGDSFNDPENTHFGYIFGAEDYEHNKNHIPSSLKKVIITGGQIKEHAFYGCQSLKSIVIQDGVTGIGEGAFGDCSGLRFVTISNSVISIGRSAFWNCTGLTSITIPNSVTNIGDYAFSSCDCLQTAYIGEGVTSIGKGAFWDCKSLRTVTIPNSVINIGKDAFKDCTNLESVTIPKRFAGFMKDGLKEIFGERNWENIKFTFTK